MRDLGVELAEVVESGEPHDVADVVPVDVDDHLPKEVLGDRVVTPQGLHGGHEEVEVVEVSGGLRFCTQVNVH